MRSTSNSNDFHNETKSHRDLEELLNCPNCKPRIIEKVKPDLEGPIKDALLKSEREKRKGMKAPKLCEDCGEIVDAEKERECPTCHGTRL